MNIPRELIRYYFDYAISDFLDDNETVPTEWGELDEYIPNLKATLMQNHEQMSFAHGLKKVLSNSHTDFQKYYGYEFPLENDEIKSIMTLLLNVVSPKEILSINSVEITDDSIEDFRIRNGLLHKVVDGQTLKSIASLYDLSLDFVCDANPYWFEKLGSDQPIEAGQTVRLKLADQWH